MGEEGIPRRVLLVGVCLQRSQQRREKAISRHLPSIFSSNVMLQVKAHGDAVAMDIHAASRGS